MSAIAPITPIPFQFPSWSITTAAISSRRIHTIVQCLSSLHVHIITALISFDLYMDIGLKLTLITVDIHA